MFQPTRDQLADLADLYGNLSPAEICDACAAAELAVKAAKEDCAAGRVSYSVVKEALADLYAIRGIKARLAGGLA